MTSTGRISTRYDFYFKTLIFIIFGDFCPLELDLFYDLNYLNELNDVEKYLNDDLNGLNLNPLLFLFQNPFLRC